MPAPAMPPPGFDDLSPEEQIAYVEALWNRIAAKQEDVPVPDWHRQVLAERLNELKDGDVESRPWSEVRADIQKKLRSSISIVEAEPLRSAPQSDNHALLRCAHSGACG